MFHGSIVALISPMTNEGKLDFDRLRKLIEWHIEQGSDGILIGGSTGEAASLSLEEKLSLTEHAVGQAKQRIPIIVANNLINTQHSIQLTHRIAQLGVDAVLLTVPAYVRPTQEGLYQHFKAIAEAVALPQILYNVPSRTACDLLPETLQRLAPIANIIGLKDATGSLNRLLAIQDRGGHQLDLYSGDDASAKDFIRLGGKGVISITANLVPRLMHQLYEASHQQQLNTAKALNDKLAYLHHATTIESNPIPVKWAMAKLGFIAPGIRLPLTPLSADKHAMVEHALEYAGIMIKEYSECVI